MGAIDNTAQSVAPKAEGATGNPAAPPADNATEGKTPSGGETPDYIAGILDEYGLQSPAELAEFIGNLAGLKGKIGDQDLDELIENSAKLKAYRAEWARAERERVKEGETPEDTIARLEHELEESATAAAERDRKRQKSESAKKALATYGETVSGVVRADASVPAEYLPFFNEFMGVNSPINDLNITDRAAVMKAAKAGVQKLKAFEQQVIKRYRAGKGEIPYVPETDTSAAAAPGAKKIKTLQEARVEAQLSLPQQLLRNITGRK